MCPEKVLASEKQPIRIFMVDGRNDNRGTNDKGEYDPIPAQEIAGGSPEPPHGKHWMSRQDLSALFVQQ